MISIDVDEYAPKFCAYCGSKDIKVAPLPKGQEVKLDPEKFLKSEEYQLMREHLKKANMDPSILYEWKNYSAVSSTLPLIFGVYCNKCSRQYSVDPQIKV
jgi:hypothetical protein